MAKAKKQSTKKAKASAAPETPPQQQVVRELMPERKAKSLLSATKSHRKQISELTGSLREKIGYAKANDHLHTKAWAAALSLEKMEPEELAIFFDHFNHYCDVLGITEAAESAPMLPLDKGGEGDDDQGGEETERNPGDSNVTRLRAAGGGAGASAEVG